MLGDEGAFHSWAKRRGAQQHLQLLHYKYGKVTDSLERLLLLYEAAKRKEGEGQCRVFIRLRGMLAL